MAEDKFLIEHVQTDFIHPARRYPDRNSRTAVVAEPVLLNLSVGLPHLDYSEGTNRWITRRNLDRGHVTIGEIYLNPISKHRAKNAKEKSNDD